MKARLAAAGLTHGAARPGSIRGPARPGAITAALALAVGLTAHPAAQSAITPTLLCLLLAVTALLAVGQGVGEGPDVSEEKLRGVLCVEHGLPGPLRTLASHHELATVPGPRGLPSCPFTRPDGLRPRPHPAVG